MNLRLNLLNKKRAALSTWAGGQCFQKGQTLIEVLVAMATAVVVMSAIATTVITSLSNVEFTKNQNLATQYSREGLEVVRRLARSNWQAFKATYNATFYCLRRGSTTPEIKTGNNCGQNIDVDGKSLFVREINIENIEQNPAVCQGNVKILSIVSWSDSRCGSSDNPFCHEVRLDSCIANIDPIPTP